MKNQFLSIFSALGISLLLLLGVVALRSYRQGISIHLGSDTLPPLPTPTISRTASQTEALLPRGSRELGLQRFATSEDREPDPSLSFFGPRLGSPESFRRSNEALREIVQMRRNIEAGKKPVVPLDGRTVSLLAEKPPGGEAVGPPASQWQGPYGGGEEGTFVVSDQTSWQNIWRRVSTQGRPAVDFADSEVVAVFLGFRPTGGFGVEILSAPVEKASALTVFWREIQPAPGHTPPEGATSPFAMRLIQKSSLPVRFEKLP